MTDETTEQPQTLKVFTCYNPRTPTQSCYALIEDARGPRRLHREWHESLVSKEEGSRKAVRARDEEIARLHEQIGEYKRAVDAYEHEVSGFHGQVQRVETPPPVVPLQINREGYTEEELGSTPSPEVEEEPAAVASGIETYASVTDSASEPVQGQIDPSGLYAPGQYGAPGTVL